MEAVQWVSQSPKAPKEGRKQEGNGPIDLRQQGRWEIDMWPLDSTSTQWPRLHMLPCFSASIGHYFKIVIRRRRPNTIHWPAWLRRRKKGRKEERPPLTKSTLLGPSCKQRAMIITEGDTEECWNDTLTLSYISLDGKIEVMCKLHIWASKVSSKSYWLSHCICFNSDYARNKCGALGADMGAPNMGKQVNDIIARILGQKIN